MLHWCRSSRSLLPLMGSQQCSRTKIPSNYSRAHSRLRNNRFHRLNVDIHEQLRTPLSTRKCYQLGHYFPRFLHRSLPHVVRQMGEQETRQRRPRLQTGWLDRARSTKARPQASSLPLCRLIQDLSAFELVSSRGWRAAGALCWDGYKACVFYRE